MKVFQAISFLVSASELACAARLGSGEISNVSGEISNVSGEISNWRQEGTCVDNHQVKRDVESRCIMPGHSRWNTITCWGCLDFGIFGKKDTHPLCVIECCDKDVNNHPGVNFARSMREGCQCTPTGWHYTKGWPHYVVHGNDAAKCCGTGTQPGGVCGCSVAGHGLRHGGIPSRDCCGGWAVHGICKNRQCGKKNTKSSQCCRQSDGTAPVRNNMCACFRAGKGLWAHDDVDGSNCCSGHMDASNQKCACISSPETPLPEGASKEDCCSGETQTKEGVEYCKAAKCTELGAEAPKGHHCCSGKEKGGTCACIPVGDAAPENERDCCSGRKEGGKCIALGKGEMPNLALTDESVCLSGEVSDGKCSCFHGGRESKNASQCCSEEHVGGGEICSCIHVGMDLEDGADASDCCSKTLDENSACGCISGHTKPLAADQSATDCCTGEVEERGARKYCRPAYCSEALLSLTNTSVNSLGATGPGKDGTVIQYLDVFPDLGRIIHLVVSNTTEYTPRNSLKNGMKDNESFGQLNVKSGTNVSLRFSFIDAGSGKPATIPNFLFSFLDLDTSTKKGTGVEFVTVKGFNSFKTSDKSLVRFESTDGHSGTFRGTQSPYGQEDPSDLRNMTEPQMQRLVTFEFPDAEGFDVVLGASKGRGGRNILFGGASQLYCGPRK